jgi:hypothetical protein
MIAVTPEGEATVVDYPDTGFGPQISAQAWSSGEPIEVRPYREHHGWARVAGIVSGIAVGTAAVIGGLTLLIDQPVSSTSTTIHTSTAAPANPFGALEYAPEPTPMVAVPDTVHITHDGEYLHTLVQHGWTVTNTSDALNGAHIVCSNLAKASKSYVIWWTLHNDPTTPAGTTEADVEFLVNTDESFYCPQ